MRRAKHVGRHATSPTMRHREHGVTVRLDARPERRERLTREPDHLERARRCGARCPARSRAADAGSTAASSAYAAARPSGVATSASNSRAHREILGRERQRIDRPPASRDRCRRRAARACRATRCRRPRRARPAWKRATDQSSDGSATSIRWCGTAARSADGGLGGSDVEPAVDLHRVDRDDLHVAERVRRREREVGLAGRSGADECEVRHAGAAVTGIRTRRSTRSPRSQCGAAEVMPTSARDAGALPDVGLEVHELVLAGAARPHRRVLLRRAFDQHLLACARRALRASPARGARPRRPTAACAPARLRTARSRRSSRPPACPDAGRTRTCRRRRTTRRRPPRACARSRRRSRRGSRR